MGEGTAVPAAKEEQHSKLPFPLEKARDIFINGGVRIIVTIAGFYLSIIAFALTALNVLKKKNITGLVSSPKDRSAEVATTKLMEMWKVVRNRAKLC